ncbi:MAG: hypothetical protein PHD72_04650, partial [Patescibacteria group bacterium]|nr:hypothetical protein [Patescibacteria group bacterium]
AEVSAQTAKISGAIKSPVISSVVKNNAGNYVISGTADALATVVVSLSDNQTLVYTGQADKNGQWQVEQDQKAFRLTEGNHSLLAFTFDQKTGTRSVTAPEQFFKVQYTQLDRLIKNVDLLANWSVVIIILLGMFLTALTI